METAFKNISDKLIRELDKASMTLQIAIAWFTNESIFEKLLEKLDDNIKVDLIIINDSINLNTKGIEFDKFIAKGGNLFLAESKTLMHNKFAIIDSNTVLTGSYNWTYNAEFRNKENIVIIPDSSIIPAFEQEFNDLISKSSKQTIPIPLPNEIETDIQVKKFVKNDLISKSAFHQDKGQYIKAIFALQQAAEIIKDDQEIEEKLASLKSSRPYHYHVEDGQFWFDFTDNKLLGKERDIIRVKQPYDELENDIYILFIDDRYVECIGSFERYFPQDENEHNRLKAIVLSSYRKFNQNNG